MIRQFSAIFLLISLFSIGQPNQQRPDSEKPAVGNAQSSLSDQQETSQPGASDLHKFDNTSTCEMTIDLYKKHIGLKDQQTENKKDKKECIQPGCFYIFKQTNLGWQKWAPSLFKNAKHTDENSIMGCRYDIPYLIQRTHGSSDRSLHKILEMLRACFIKDTLNKEKELSFSFCQPEYDKDYNKTSDGSTATSFNGTGIYNKNFHDSWIDRHLPSVQDKCFYKFASGIFFVKSGKRNLIVCCSDGNKDNEKKFKDACKAVTAGINNMKWREKTKIDG